jgi:superfamily II DNA/RNA helicase
LLIDNENKNKKVYEWIQDYTNTGTLDIVTGYFTIGALNYISKTTNSKIDKYRFILGDIVSTEQLQSYTIDLLNENLSIEASLKLKSIAIEAVEFLKQEKVEVKTLEPNFCHAKAYIFDDIKDDRHKYFITGSSNLTESGIGLKYTNNIELNIAETGSNDQFKNLFEWFNELWNKPQAHYKKTVIDKKGKKQQVDFKEYLLKQIETIFIEYTPETLYYKVLFELFGEELLKEQDNPKFNKEIGKLETSIIYKTLYEFQKKGVLSLIKMLEHYDGAILADAVGLGKTWSALAVIKYYQFQGRETILLCPKKLENNWKQYLKRKNSKFKNDDFDFIVRYHTDLFENRLEKDDIDFNHLQSDKPKLLVIDESHNLRNAKSNRYKFLVETLLKKNQNIKVLLLSATPINNSLNDIRNQFKLMTKDDDNGFYEKLGIKSINGTFKTSQIVFNKWIETNNKHISHFIKELPSEFFKLTDSLTVARTRNMILKHSSQIEFPVKKIPQNIYVSPKNIGKFKTFTELFDSLPPKLTAYKPAYYIDDDISDVTHNEKLRDKALVRMIYILLAKRFESSWKSFYDTIVKVQLYHQDIYNKAQKYKKTKEDNKIINNIKGIDIDEEFIIGKREIRISQIDKCGNIDTFIDDLKLDITSMKTLIQEIEKFKNIINKENSITSKDTKLEELIRVINKKQESQNKKLIIFTAYTDTAIYISEQLKTRGIKKTELVHGNTKNYETILQKFAPFTKLFKEKQWNDYDGDKNNYNQWKIWISKNDANTNELLNNQVDILIATDVLSEGQNLQDANMVINYDIHWNPVRIIQRMGRIDRIGSPNKEIEGVNFWPSKDINDYLGLQNRIEQRMTTMKIVGSEIDTNFTDKLKNMAEDENLEQSQIAKMLLQMQTSWDDIETSDNSLGFNDLSLEQFRQDLYDELQKKNDFYRNMPKGIFTGFKKYDTMDTYTELLALLKNRKTKQYELIYLDKDGNIILQNQKDILEFLSFHKTKDRYVSKDIDSGKIEDINKLQLIIQKWIHNLYSKDITNEDGIIKKKAGKKAVDVLNKLKIGQKQAVEKVKENLTIEKEFNIGNYDLIVWFVIE